jgi:hypothetical protein
MVFPVIMIGQISSFYAEHVIMMRKKLFLKIGINNFKRV